MGASPKFWDRHAVGYSKTPIKDEAAYQHKLEKTREYLDAEMDVLELGCGTGSTAIIHAPHVRHIRAVDISSKMLEIARERAAQADASNIIFEQSTLEALQVTDESIDIVLALSLLHLLEDRQTALAKIYRMLKPGGVFVSSTACLNDSMSFLKYVLPIGRVFGLLPFVAFFTEDELQQNVVEAGFQLEYYWRAGKGKATFLIARKAG